MCCGRAVAAFAAVVLCAAQAARPSFDAASVKRSSPANVIVRLSTLPGRLSGSNVTLRMLIRTAYNVRDSRMIGGPSWLDADRFDVEATAGAFATADEVRAMTRTFLEDRFQLKTHPETRELPVYAMSFARRDGRLGDGLKPSGLDCRPITPPEGAPPPPPPPPGGPGPNGARQCPSLLMNGNISGRKLTIERLATTLSLFADREVVDRTQLAGEFDVELRWLPNRPGAQIGAPPPPGLDQDAPSLFTAVQEQLGVKLEPSRAPIDVLIIDSAEKPTQD